MRQFIWAAGLAVLAGLGSGKVFAQHQNNAQQDDDYYPLIMLGDALEVCSSMAWQRCFDTDWLDVDSMRSDRYLNLSEKSITPLLASKNWPMRTQVRDDLKEALELLKARIKQDVVSERVFLEEFTRRATRYMYDQLSEQDWNMMIDYLELPVASDAVYGVNLKATKAGAGRDYLELIVGEAKKAADGETPHVLVVTAAQRDSLDLVNYYLQSFASAGADASWLPLDVAVMAAREAEACDELDSYRASEMGAYRRGEVHRELGARQAAFCAAGDALTQLRNADAVYFADGNPDLLRPLFVTSRNEPNALAVALAERVAKNKLVVAAAGRSANVLTGKAVLTGGSSREALREGVYAARVPGLGCHKDNTCPRNLNEHSVTYHPMGGIGLFRWGTIDTRMGEQGNHGRLLRVAATNRVPMAVGVDAATALAVNLRSGDFKVAGERGVFVAVGAQQNERAVAAGFNYLMAGSKGRFSNDGVSNVTLASEAEVVQLEPTTNFLSSRGMYDALRLLCRERDSVEVKQDEFTLTLLGGEAATKQKAGAECQVQNARIGMQYAPPEKF